MNLLVHDLTAEERKQLDAQIVTLIERSQQGADEISRLTLDCVSVLASVQARATSIERQGALQRLWRNLNGKNATQLVKNQRDLARAHYAALQVIRKLQEQELITADLLGIVRAKLDALVYDTETDLSELYALLGASRQETRDELRKLDQTIEAVKRDQALNRWVATIATVQWGDLGYCDLDPISQALCVVNDFFHLTFGHREGGQVPLQLLQTAMQKLGRKSNERISTHSLFEALEAAPALIDRFLQSIDLESSDVDPIHAPSVAGVRKFLALTGEERHVVETASRVLHRHGIDCTRRELRLSLVREYLRAATGQDLDQEFSPLALTTKLLAELYAAARPPEAPQLLEVLPEPVTSSSALPAALTAKELGLHLRLTGAELVADLRGLSRLERPEQIIPAQVALAVAERRGAAVTISVPPAPPADLQLEFGWWRVANPQEGLLPGNIRTNGNPLTGFDISGGPVTKRQFASVLQRFIDVHGGIAFLFSDSPVVYQTRIYLDKGLLRIANAERANLADREVVDWSEWFCRFNESKVEYRPWDGDGMPKADLVICNLEAAGLRLANNRIATLPHREDQPVTGVTYMGAVFFADQLTRLHEDKWQFAIPSARHYALLDRDLDVECTVPFPEWCNENVLYTGPNQFDIPETRGTLGAAFRLIRKEPQNRSTSSWSRWS